MTTFVSGLILIITRAPPLEPLVKPKDKIRLQQPLGELLVILLVTLCDMTGKAIITWSSFCLPNSEKGIMGQVEKTGKISLDFPSPPPLSCHLFGFFFNQVENQLWRKEYKERERYPV